MTLLEEQFEEAATRVHTLRERPSNDVLLNLYSLHKQATLGDVQGEKPAMFDFINLAKYNAWATRKGMSREEAMKSYIELVNSLFA